MRTCVRDGSELRSSTRRVRELHEEIDTLMFGCVGAENPACINRERDNFQADLAATKHAYHSLTGPESREGACYRAFNRYFHYLSALTSASDTIFAAADTGSRAALRGGFDNETSEPLKHRTMKDQMLAVCGKRDPLVLLGSGRGEGFGHADGARSTAAEASRSSCAPSSLGCSGGILSRSRSPNSPARLTD